MENDAMENDAIKGFSILPGPGPLLNNLMPSIIVKFVHFNDKIEIYKNRRTLKTLKNDLNGKKHMDERAIATIGYVYQETC